MKMNTDHVDTILAQWAKERPDIDSTPMAVTGRLAKVTHAVSQAQSRVFSEFGLNMGEFDVLATLLRSGSPYSLTPNQLLQALMLSSGAMTNRVDRLEAKALVYRQADPNDRRGVLVTLTATGSDLINQVVVKHVDKGHGLLDPLTLDEQALLARLLKKLLIAYER
ncbi:MarR family winged helix-turn-helix transcriptional regulator [Shewanella surugensis]|uniref:MarR family transcriptional regulator n=1 Tax=Shewanella surugensis TaxID=212020 RepID=A0ABT0LEV4_9GAMM|nr:MarR family transcriptional regulator [Shewanella surugensis]MCL1126208.1 MarR family transcriptional regulator [Shewanella surugensis]